MGGMIAQISGYGGQIGARMYILRRTRGHPSYINEHWKRISAIPTENDAFIRQMMAAQQWRCFDRLPNLEAPTLILHGADDILVPPGNAAVLASCIPNATVKIYEGAGHGFTAQMPLEVSDGAYLSRQIVL